MREILLRLVVFGRQAREQLLRRGAVRRAKLYYLRGRTGKSARIAERRDVRRDIPGGKGAETEKQEA